VETNRIDLAIVGLIIFSVSCGVTGQVLFKLGMRDAGPVTLGPSVLLHFLHPRIFAGCCCYATATVSWLVILSRVPLSLAYPLVSISYVLVALLGRFYLHETVTPYTWAGVALICLGVGLIGYGSPHGSAPTPPAPTASRVPER